MEKVVVWLIVLFLFFVLPSILQALAKRRLQQQPPPPPAEEEPEEAGEAEEESPYRAGSSEIERYLESIGVKIERRAPPARPERHPGPRIFMPEAPPAPRPEPQRMRVVVREEVFAPAPAEPPAAAPEEPPAVVGERPAPMPQAPGPGVAAGALAVLAGRPTVSDLRRGVILAEILSRPDFQQLPCDRLLSFGSGR